MKITKCFPLIILFLFTVCLAPETWSVPASVTLALHSYTWHIYKYFVASGHSKCLPCLLAFAGPAQLFLTFLWGFCYHGGPRSTLTHSCGIASFKMAPAGEIFVLRSKFVLGPWKFDLCKRTVNMIILLVFWVIISLFLQKHVVLYNLFICFMNKKWKQSSMMLMIIKGKIIKYHNQNDHSVLYLTLFLPPKGRINPYNIDHIWDKENCKFLAWDSVMASWSSGYVIGNWIRVSRFESWKFQKFLFSFFLNFSSENFQKL